MWLKSPTSGLGRWRKKCTPPWVTVEMSRLLRRNNFTCRRHTTVEIKLLELVYLEACSSPDTVDILKGGAFTAMFALRQPFTLSGYLPGPTSRGGLGQKLFSPDRTTTIRVQILCQLALLMYIQTHKLLITPLYKTISLYIPKPWIK